MTATRRPFGRVLAACAVALGAAAGSFGAAPAAAQDSLTLVIANGWSLSDIGTAASMVAAGEGDAVLYASGESLGAAGDLIAGQQPGRVVLVGGTAALAATVDAEIGELAPSAAISRLAGTDRIDTAAQAARRIGGQHSGSTLVIANGWSLSDVGTAASVVASGGADAVLYSSQGGLGDASAAVIAERRPARILLVGGTAAIAAGVEAEAAAAAPSAEIERLGGDTRIETAALSSERALREGATAAVIANGWAPAEVGIAAGYAAAGGGAAVLYSTDDRAAGPLQVGIGGVPALVCGRRRERLCLLGEQRVRPAGSSRRRLRGDRCGHHPRLRAHHRGEDHVPGQDRPCAVDCADAGLHRRGGGPDSFVCARGRRRDCLLGRQQPGRGDRARGHVHRGGVGG